MLPELARQRAGEGEHGALGCDIGQHARHALIGGARGDVDDLAAAALDHVRYDVADHQIRASHVDRHHAIPQLRVPLVEVSGLERGVERRVVHQDVYLTEAFDGLSDQALDRLLVADVELDAGHAICAMAAGDFRGKVLAVGDVGDHHARAFGGERLRIMPADALGAAGDDRGFSFQSCHTLLPAAGDWQILISYEAQNRGGFPCREIPPTAWPSVIWSRTGRSGAMPAYGTVSAPSGTKKGG